MTQIENPLHFPQRPIAKHRKSPNLKIKRVLATLLTAVFLSMGFAVADPAPASAYCPVTRLYNSSYTYSVYYMDQYNQWNTLRPRSYNASGKNPRQAQTPVGRNATVRGQYISTFNTSSGEKWLVYSCKGDYNVYPY